MSELSFTVHATKHIAGIERASATVTRIAGELVRVRRECAVEEAASAAAGHHV